MTMVLIMLGMVTHVWSSLKKSCGCWGILGETACCGACGDGSRHSHLRRAAHDGTADLEGLVVLQQLLDITGNSVVLCSDDVGVHDTGGGVEGVDGGVDAALGDATGQDGGGVQVRKGGGGGGVSQVVSGHVDGLDRCDGSLLGGGDTLLHGSHVSGQGWLVSDSGWDTSEQGGHLGTGLGEPEDVVDEEEHVLALLVTEVLSHGQTGQSNTGTGARGLVHLAVHEGDLGGLVLEGDDTALNHLVVEIVALPGPLADAGEHRETTVGLGNVVDQLHDKHSLADSGAAEETNLTSLAVGGEQVDDLDTGDKNLLLDGHLVKVGSLGVDGLALVSGDGSPLVNRVADHVDDAAKGLLAHGDGDGESLILNNITPDKTLGTVHGNGPDGVLSEVLGDLQDELGLPADDGEGVEDLREPIVELDVHDGTNDGDNLALVPVNSRSHRELALVCDCRQSLGDIAGDGLPDEP